MLSLIGVGGSLKHSANERERWGVRKVTQAYSRDVKDWWAQKKRHSSVVSVRCRGRGGPHLALSINRGRLHLRMWKAAVWGTLWVCWYYFNSRNLMWKLVAFQSKDGRKTMVGFWLRLYSYVVVSTVASQQKGSWFQSQLGPFCVCMFSPFSQDTLASSHHPKLCMWG